MKKSTRFTSLFAVISVTLFVSCTKTLDSIVSAPRNPDAKMQIEAAKASDVLNSIRKSPGGSYVGTGTLGDSTKAY